MIDDALHALARLLLRFCSAPRAHAILAMIGELLPPHAQQSDIERVATRLKPRGSCLSRALALAARIPDADIVIGVTPRSGEKLFAHAWLERSGVAIEPREVAGAVIARFGRVRHTNAPAR